MTSAAPSWLLEPPDGSKPNPPVETRGQALPLGELSWQDFERLILRLVRREGEVIECAIYGTPGQAQSGIDILANHLEQATSRVCCQCKKVVEFSPADIATAVDKFLSGKWAQDATEFVLCVSASLESTQLQDELDRQRNRLFEQNIALSVWDGAAAGAICERLKSWPDLVDDFFGRPWVTNFNGSSAATRLGERLNGYELGELRARLLALYTVLFTQHDPGLRAEGDRRLDYRDRYVTADVVERTHVDIVSPEISVTQPAIRKDDSSADRDHLNRVGGLRSGSATYETRRAALEWLRYQRKCVVLGEPGYGKSAMLRYLALSILQPEKLDFDALDPSYFSLLPVWIPFARFSAAVANQQGVSIDDFFHTWLHQYSFDDIYPLFQRAARGGQVLLLVDGLDEAFTEHSGREALDRIVTFLQAFDASVVCTSRPKSYRLLGAPPSWAVATLIPLSDQKIEELATRWFDFLEPATGCSVGPNEASWGLRRAQAFLRAARGSPKTLELARNPLLCQSLIELFRFSHQLPEVRIMAYKQIVELLLSKHPAARTQAGGNSSSVGHLDLRMTDLTEILVRLAWSMQLQPGGTLARNRCEEVCTEFLVDDTFGLGESYTKASRVAGEIIGQLATHYGVLVERAPGEFSLLHLSIQEYLAAESVARLPPEEQLAWLDSIWTSQVWRESLIAWFGILGARGDKALSGKASQRLAELGENGEWLRIKSLELRTEIATADLGLPISEARSIIVQASREVEISPFRELRAALSSCIAIGALGTPVRSECQSVLRRWLPGHSSMKRKLLLEAFKKWKPSDTLRASLIRAFQDEDVACRRAAVDTFSAVFSSDTNTLSTLKWFAIHHIRPEVRAAALYGLGERPEWATVAAEGADANRETSNVELFLAVLRVQIQQNIQSEDDLNRLFMVWTTDAIDFSLRHAPLDLLCSGWPRHERLRRHCMERLERQSGTAYIELPLLYLIRCYPSDEEVAAKIVLLIKRFGRYIALDQEAIWDALYFGFRGHLAISNALREVLQADREEYKRIFWEPRTVSIMTVLGDEEARNELLESYERADSRGRYWIASALLKGWGEDDLVQRELLKWASGDISMAAPLASFGKELIPDVEQRYVWLLKLAHETVSTREVGAIVALLRDFPSMETKRIAEGFLDKTEIWYYHRVTLQGLYAKAYPNEPKSIEILESSLSQIDGPNPGSLAESFQDSADFSVRLLTAAVPAPTDVRVAVATVLRERAVDYETVLAVTPLPFAEDDSAVRASCLMARARAARIGPEVPEGLVETLMSELNATGSYMDMRRRTALAALLELGAYEKIVSAFATGNSREWTSRLIEWFGPDPVSVSAVVEHWGVLKPLLQQSGLNAELPISEIVRVGYDLLLEQDPSLQQALENYFDTHSPDLISSAYFDAFARRRPKSATLRSILLKVLGGTPRGEILCSAARVLAVHFRSQQDIWPELATRLGSPADAADQVAEGVLGHIALGWPGGEVAEWFRTLHPNSRAQLHARDRLLFAVLLKESLEAEKAAEELVLAPRVTWRHSAEDTNALRIWAGTDEAESSLERWIVSDNPSLSLTAVSLMAIVRRNLEDHTDQLIHRFNEQLNSLEITPNDGIDAATGQQVAWVVSIYSTLKDWSRKTI